MPLTTASYYLRPLQLSGLENVRTCLLWQGHTCLIPCHLPSTQHNAWHGVWMTLGSGPRQVVLVWEKGQPELFLRPGAQ